MAQQAAQQARQCSTKGDVFLLEHKFRDAVAQYREAAGHSCFLSTPLMSEHFRILQIHVEDPQVCSLSYSGRESTAATVLFRL